MLSKSPREYAKQYNVSLRTIQRYAAAGYPLDDPQAMSEKLAHQKNQPGAVRGPLTVSKEMKLKLECDKLAFSLAVMKGEYTANADIRRDITAIATATRQALVRLESELPGVLAGLDEPAIKILLREKINQIIEQLGSALNPLYATGPLSS